MTIDVFGNTVEVGNNSDFLITELIEGEFTFDGDGGFYEFDSNCILLYDIFRNKLFHNLELYYRQRATMPLWLYSGGHDSDINIDKLSFEKLLQKHGSEKTFKHVYLADCYAMISALQDRLLFVKGYFIEFYKNLYLLEGNIIEKDAVVWLSGHKAASVFSNLYNIFISVYSSFDLITKIAYEVENTHEEYDSYPKLASARILFGAKNRLGDIDVEGTVFENCESINTIVNIRNELIHNGSWETNPKVFMEIKNAAIIKKWILFPDTEKGNISSIKNRKRFFSKGEKINEKLPSLLLEMLDRMNNTIKMLVKSNTEKTSIKI